MRTLGRLGSVLGATVLLTALATGCGLLGDEEATPSTDLGDPCALLSDPLLDRLAPDAEPPEASEILPETSGSGYLSCAVDLTTAPAGGFRGDLGIQVRVDSGATFDEDWQVEHCAEVGADVTTEGPGDTGCIAVQRNDGLESRVDAWAWVGSDYEVSVGYQLIFPEELPPSAEEDVRNLLGAAVDQLPTND